MLGKLRQGRSVRHVCTTSWDGMQHGQFPGLLEVAYSEQGVCLSLRRQVRGQRTGKDHKTEGKMSKGRWVRI